jgi:hypothetical protein
VDKLPEIKKVIVEEGGKKSAPIFIPQSGDRVYDRELETWATETERNRMRNEKPREPSRANPNDIRKAIKEQIAYRERKRENVNRKYF